MQVQVTADMLLLQYIVI